MQASLRRSIVPMPLIVTILVILLLIYLFSRGISSSRGGSSLERQLLHLCLGDRAQVERLVQAELERAPGISRQAALERAHALLTRDKR